MLPAWRRRGIGRLLLTRAAAELVSLGFSRLHIGVLTANQPARAFYEAMGGREVGQRTFDEDGFPLPETVYAWPDLAGLVTGSRPMTDRDPDLTAEDELRSVREQLEIYDAICVAAGDAHAVLDAVLGAPDPDSASRALELRYGFTKAQAWAVMEVQFRRMTLSDRQKIDQRRDELASRAAGLDAELGRP